MRDRVGEIFFVMLGLFLMTAAVCILFYQKNKQCAGSVKEINAADMHNFDCDNGASPSLVNQDNKNYIICICK